MSKNQKTAFLTGGTRGIGGCIVRTLAARGVTRFFLNYLQNDAAAFEIEKKLKAGGAEVFLLKYNLAFPQEISQMFAEINRHTTHLDYFVHCAALTVFKPLHQVKPNQWDLTLNISTKSFLQCARACLPLMPQRGKMVAVSGTGSRRVTLDYGALGVAKSALESTVRYLAVELAPRNIRVNAVTAGLIESENMPPFPAAAEMKKETLRRTPAGRLGTPEDVAEAVLFLLTGADWMCGQCLVTDGGFSLV